MPLSTDALAERIDGVKEMMAALHEVRMSQMQQVLDRLDEMNGRTRQNSETISRNCAHIENVTRRLGQVEDEARESLNRRSIWLGITELVLAAIAWLSPRP